MIIGVGVFVGVELVVGVKVGGLGVGVAVQAERTRLKTKIPEKIQGYRLITKVLVAINNTRIVQG